MPRGRLTAILKDGPVLAVDVERMRRDTGRLIKSILKTSKPLT
jgi:hypothetical protein